MRTFSLAPCGAGNLQTVRLRVTLRGPRGARSGTAEDAKRGLATEAGEARATLGCLTTAF